MNTNKQNNKGITLSEYVVQEAVEKAYEIEIKSLKQFEKEKKAIVQRQKEVVNEDFEKKMRQKNMEQKIRHSTVVNQNRLMKMQYRDEIMTKIQSDLQKKLIHRINNDQAFYKDLLMKLMVQGMISLMENKVIVKCLERDVKLIKDVSNQAVKTFQDLVKKDLNKPDFKVEVEIDQKNYLKDTRDVQTDIKIPKSEENKKCIGGILMTDSTRLIIVKNTLDCRIDLCIQESLPDIRKVLFA